MANYSELIATINDQIKANGNQEITGPVLNAVLQAMVSALGEGYQFMGVATPDTDPGTPDGKVFYIATQAGTYTNFAINVIGVSFIYFGDTSWTKEEVDIATTDMSSFIIPQSTDYNLTVEKSGNILTDSGYVESSGHNVYRLSGNLVALKRKIYLNIQSSGAGYSAVYAYNSSNEVIGSIAYIGTDGIISRSSPQKILVDLAYGFDGVDYLLINSDILPTLYQSAFNNDSYPTKIEEYFSNFTPYNDNSGYTLELQKDNNILTTLGTYVSNTSYCVLKLSGNIVNGYKQLFFPSYYLTGRGLYAFTIYNTAGEIIGQQAYFDNSNLVGGKNDLLLDLNYGYSDIGYVLINCTKSTDFALSRIKILTQRFANMPTDNQAIKDLIAIKATQALIIPETAQSSSYSFELYASNKIVMEDGSIPANDYDNFNVYKLSGSIIDQKKRIYLNDLYNDGLALWLVSLYNADGLLIYHTGYIDTSDGLQRGYNDILIDLTLGGIFNNVSYALICIKGTTLPVVAYDRYVNAHQYYSDIPVENDGYVKIVDCNGTVGIDCDYTTLKDAVDFANSNKNTTIFIKSGTYDIISEFGDDYMTSISESDNNYKGLQIGNGVKIIGKGIVLLTANYAGNNDYAKAKFSVFNIVSDFHLENLAIEVTNVRYCVHEDSPFDHVDYIGIYKNVKMTHHGTNGTSYTAVCCLGGGCTGNSVSQIVGCEFDNDFTDDMNQAAAVSYHNNYNSAESAQVLISDSYFHGNQTFQTWLYQEQGSFMRVVVSNNKLGQAIKYAGGVGTKIDSLVYNNTIEVTED